MGISVDEAMKIGGLQKSKVISGFDGLNNIIEYISVLEVPDADNWFRGKELLLTAFYNIGDDINLQINLLKKMRSKNVSALGVCYPGRYYQKYHPEFLELANQLNIPVIEIPDDVAYIDVISPLSKKIYNNYSDYIFNLQNLFLEWFNSKEGLDKITHLLGKYIGCSIAITDENFNLLSDILSFNEEKVITNWINENKFVKFKNHDIYYFNGNNLGVIRLQQKKELFGYCIILLKNKKELDELVLNTISTNLALYLSHPNLKMREEKIHKQKIINDWILTGKLSVNEVKHYTQKINWNIEPIVGIALIKSKKMQEFIEENVSKLHWFKANDNLGFFIKDIHLENELISTIDKYIQLRIEEVGPQNLVYYINKDNKSFITNVNENYAKLAKLLVLQSNIPNMPQTINIDHFPIITFISQESFNPKKFLKLIEPIILYDEQYDSDLYLTVEHLLFISNIQDICNQLNIHRNTLNYRRQKIIDILGENPVNRINISQYQIAAYCKHLFSS